MDTSEDPEDDQSLADDEQTLASADQEAAEGDQRAAENDQEAADSDQEASDRDLADGGDPVVHGASREIRDHSADQRRDATRKRSDAAVGRDSVATSRDLAAEARDRAADMLDRDLAEREAESQEAGSSAAASARVRGAADRRQAAHDRGKAAADRLQAQEDRDALQRQVAISEMDGLTGTLARVPGLADLDLEIDRARRTTGILAVAYLDIVGLKAVNDAQGHSAGDALLKNAVRVIRAHLRPYDAIIRVGGDEFLCAMPGATIENARRRFDAVQAALATDPQGCELKIGIAALSPDDSATELIDRADAALMPRDGRDVFMGPGSSARDKSRSSEGPAATRILVTDDHPEMLHLIDRALGDSFECEFANSVEQAHMKLATGAFDLAICNLATADRPGLELAAEIVGDYPSTATVVLMTGEDDPEAAKRAFALGVYGYLVEPFWPGQLLITVLSALRRRRLEIVARAHSQNLEDRRQTIIDMAPIGIYAKDTTGHYVVANEKADELAGLGPGGLMGLTDDAFMAPDHAKLGPDSDSRVFEEGAVHEREDSVVIAGVRKTFKTIRFPLLDEDGEITAVGGVSVDVTDEREAIRLRDELAATQQKAIEELRLSRLETIEGLAKAIELHDSPTADHVNRMGAISAFLGAQLGFDADRVQLLRAAAPMHDVGKIGTPSALLRKAGLLSEDERTEMERHTVVGHAIFADFESDLSRLAATIALTHHEHYDGSGYPHGLVAEEIPLEGRITAVADVFDALLSDRSYRPAMPVEEAVGVIREGRGTHFDPRIVDVLLEHVNEALLIRA
jgi:diguanylate cyclase (GGDEF)-like protein/PAS domain S-box-containing protein